MNKQLTLASLLLLFFCSSISAQKLFRPFETISHKKPTYITLESGEEIEGTVKKLKRKKGLIKEFNIKNEKGEKLTIPIEDIKYAYLPQSGWDKFTKFDSYISDATQWDDGLHDKDRIKEGYAFFEKSKVLVKKNEMTLLVQLLNPGNCSRVKVYHDPYANETTSFGVAGVTLAGGDDKSYYISKDGEVAYRLKKNKYKKTFDDVFGDCRKVNKEYKAARWNEFEEALFMYNGSCEK